MALPLTGSTKVEFPIRSVSLAMTQEREYEYSVGLLQARK